VTSAEPTALDASVLVAGLLSWHPRHPDASTALIQLLSGDEEVLVPGQALIESYAVMTRLPPPHRLSPQAAATILTGTLRGRVRLAWPEGEGTWSLVEELSRQGVAGGTAYDGLIVATARKAGARRILTLNRAHFERVADTEMEVVVPGGAAAG
jgi:predicted nucleic acid-binding protein